MAVRSPSEKRRADEQKSDIRLSSRVEWAPDHEDQLFALYSKSDGCVATDICSRNICIPAIRGGYSSCAYSGRSVAQAAGVVTGVKLRASAKELE